jgi:hypothetical protein
MGKLKKLLLENNLSVEFHSEGTDKDFYHSYIENFYEPLFESFQEAPLSIFEIGIQYKSSLALWKLYFPTASVSGCDINISQPTHPVASKMLQDGSIKISESDVYQNIEAIPNNLTLLIDDGPHTISSQLIALSLRTKLSDKGVLVIEDLGDIGGSVYCFRKLLKSLPRSERKYCLAIDMRSIKQRWDDAVFLYSKDEVLLESLKSRIGHLILSPFKLKYLIIRYSFSKTLRNFLGFEYFQRG